MAVAVGDIAVGKVTKIMPFGAFVRLENGESGLVHISEVSSGFVKDINEGRKFVSKLSVLMTKRE